jgi:membrane-associated protein
MRKIIMLLLVLQGFNTAIAQDSIKITLNDQYKRPVKAARVVINNLAFQSDESGNISFPAVGIQSVLVTKEGFDSTTVTLATLETSKPVIVNKKFSWTDLLTPMFYIIYGGLWFLLLIIFAETGLFIGFFFPGDSLLFVAGILSTPLVNSISLNTGNDFFNLLIISSLCIIAGILGNTVGYITGRKVGPAMFNWKDRWLFKQKYLHQAKDFYDKHGGGAIIFARFLPIVRTFAPIVAGIVGMDKKKFSFFNTVGCIAWVTSMLFIGHYLNSFFKSQYGIDLEKHLEVIVIVIVLVTTAPVIMKLIFGKRKHDTAL